MAIQNPLYLQKLGYTAQNDRLLTEATSPGIGILNFGDFKVDSSSATLSLSVAAGRANLRGSDSNQGVYHVYSDSAYTVTHSANSSVNPRIDQIILRVYDSSYGETYDKAAIEIVQGTPTAGANLDNRSGAADISSYKCAIRLADVIVPANSVSSITAGSVRQRQPVAKKDVSIPIDTVTTDVAFVALSPVSGTLFATSFLQVPASQVAMQFNVPSKLSNPKFRFGYVNAFASAFNGGDANFGVYDSSGTLLATAAMPFTKGAANANVRREVTFTLSGSFEPGNYWLAYASGVSVNTLIAPAYETDWKVAQPGNVLYRQAAAGVTTLPNTLSGFSDVYSGFASVGLSKMPMFTVTDV